MQSNDQEANRDESENKRQSLPRNDGSHDAADTWKPSYSKITIEKAGVGPLKYLTTSELIHHDTSADGCVLVH
jgi:hypothetical protein